MQADKKLDKTRNVSYKRLVLSFLLTVFELFAGLSANSTLLLADAVRSFSGFINEYTKLLDISIASRPEDKSHNYGHGKVTTLCMGAGAFILLFASFRALSLSSGELVTYLQGKESEVPETAALFAAVLAFVLRSVMTILTGSPETQAKEVFLKARTPINELLISGFVIFGTGCTLLPGKGFDIADPFAAFLLSLYLLATSGGLLYRTANELIEASLDEENNLRIRKIINNTGNVKGSGELKTRRIGKKIAINVCVRVNDSLSVREAAEIANLVEEKLKAAFVEDVYVLIRIEPGSGKTLKNKGRSSEEERRKTVTLF